MPRPGDLTEYLKVFSCINFLMNPRQRRSTAASTCIVLVLNWYARDPVLIRGPGRLYRLQVVGPIGGPLGVRGLTKGLTLGRWGGLVLV